MGLPAQMQAMLLMGHGGLEQLARPTVETSRPPELPGLGVVPDPDILGAPCAMYETPV
jgi:hypothetical protein